LPAQKKGLTQLTANGNFCIFLFASRARPSILSLEIARRCSRLNAPGDRKLIQRAADRKKVLKMAKSS